jgi:hypothetical protein
MEKDTGFAVIIMAAVAVLIGLAFWPTISPNIGQMTQTFTAVNNSFTFAEGGIAKEVPFCGQKINSIIVINKSLANVTGLVPASNYTTSVCTGSDGYLSACLTYKVAAGVYNTSQVNVTCNYNPRGYVDNAAGRGMVALIAIFMAMLIAAAASPNLREWVMDKVGM